MGIEEEGIVPETGAPLRSPEDQTFGNLLNDMALPVCGNKYSGTYVSCGPF
jgi:hypothetical protein